MSEDSGRYNLVSRCVCALCGHRLRLSYDKPKAKGNDYHADHHDDHITGADKVEIQITVYPCDRCYSEARRPAEAMKEALGILERMEP